MQTFHVALYDLTVEDGQVLCQDGRPFDRVAYSRFKYGYLPPAVGYGQGLATLIAPILWEISDRQPIRIVSAPYKCLPTASHAIAQVLQEALAGRALRRGLEPPQLIPFHKAQVGDSAYARSTEADRLRSVTDLGLRIRENEVTGSHMLVVDDIRITGAAQRASGAYLESLHPASIWYLHAARLSEDLAKVHPGLEDELNQTVAHTLEGFLPEMAEGQFQLNTRVLRFILESQDEVAFRAFLDRAPITMLQEIKEAGLGNGVAYYQKYQHNLELVADTLQRRTPRHPIHRSPAAARR